MRPYLRLIVPLLVAALAVFAVASAQGAKPPSPPGKGPKLTITPSSATFGPVDPGVGASQEFAVGFKDGKTSGELTVAAAGDGFAVTDDACTGTALKPGQTCSLTVTYTPSGYGESIEATLTVTGKTDVKAAHAVLFGSSSDEPVGSLVSAEPALGFFGYKTIGDVFDEKWIAFTNNATEPLWLSGYDASPAAFVPSATADWTTCDNLQPGFTCYGVVLFEPSTPGVYEGSFTTTWRNAAGDTVATTDTPLWGKSLADLVHASLTTWDFGSVTAGTISPAKVITFTNVSTDTTVQGDSYSFYGEFGTTASTCYVNGTGFIEIAPGQTCTMSVVFTPPSVITETTPYSGLFLMEWILPGTGGEDNATIAMNTIPLSGTGVPTNQAPTADDWTVEVLREEATTITLSGSDADGDDLSFAIASFPANGTLGAIATPVCSGGYCTADVSYTSDVGYTGSDSFTFTTNDGTVDSPTAGTISITVPAPLNQGPWAQDVPDAGYWVGGTVTLTGGDPDGDSIEFFIVTQLDHGSLGSIGSPICDGVTSSYGALATFLGPMVTGSVCTVEVEYIPEEGYTGTASFTYKVSDGQLDSDIATVTFTGPS